MKMIKNRVFTFYSHKGGVGKTSTTLSVGQQLAREGKKVLLVDYDPQCNLTGSVLDTDQLETLYETSTACTVYSALDQVLGDSDIDGSRPKSRCFCPWKVSNDDELYLCGNHPMIDRFNERLTLALGNPNFPRASDIPGCLVWMYRSIQREEKRRTGREFDYILCDTSPAITPLTKLAVLSADFLVAPLTNHTSTGQYFSEMAIRSMASLLPKWDEDLRQWARTKTPTNSDFRMDQRRPLFIGTVVLTLESSSSSLEETRLIKTIEDTLIPALDVNGMTLPVGKYWTVSVKNTSFDKDTSMYESCVQMIKDPWQHVSRDEKNSLIQHRKAVNFILGTTNWTDELRKSSKGNVISYAKKLQALTSEASNTTNGSSKRSIEINGSNYSGRKTQRK